ncbi:MAG: restriction endonuclease [Lewinellaceae bacterium]|nr:restriction endonuclease [Lewinellaceae bacterium]
MKENLIDIYYHSEDVGIRIDKIKYTAEVTHKGLKDYKVFTAYDEDILENKVQSHVAKLEEKWDKIVAKQNIVNHLVASQKEAEIRTQEAIRSLNEVDNILIHTLSIDDTIDWETLKDKSKFKEPNPEIELSKKINAIFVPNPPSIENHPAKPQESDYQPKLSFLDKLIKYNKSKKIQQSKDSFDRAYMKWNDECLQINRQNETRKKIYEQQIVEFEASKDKVRKQVDDEVKAWQKSKTDFEFKQEKKNKKVDELQAKYMSCDQSAVLEYCELVLNNSQYPESFPKSFELDYNPENKILIIEYSLPTIEDLPSLNEVKFIKNELKEYYISDAQTQKMFDATMYKITLRTIHEIFEADKANAIDFVSFNGWVNAINRATGKRENNCILSIQAKKAEFIEIDLEHVDPKTCFKNFKGIGSSKLSGLTPIQPILMINRTDKRFINHYEVASGMDKSTNLASMDWEDFEHLIREVFANEFNSNGGEVKVTQASKDGGVDAIAFDPDPIRGGKIVIQAKRYTNTVGVAAVRDLFGTVMNEGATKGILVTTADYGSDAYEFAKGKPLTLMNGANLLYLLEKHGKKARIDIKEAKRLQKEG